MNKTKNYWDRRAIPVLFITILCLISQTSATEKLDQDQSDCDLKLLRSFKLKGLRRPSHRPMHICPHVTSKCCTLNDELSIYQLWNTYADYTTKRFHTWITRSWFRLVDYHDEFKKLDRNDITVHYMEWKWIPYIHRMCDRRYLLSKESASNPTPMQSELQIDNELPGMGPVRKHHYAYKPDYLDVITKAAHMKKTLEIYKAAMTQMVLEYMKIWKVGKKKMEKAQKELMFDEQMMLKNKIILANQKRARNKNKLHIFGPKATKAILGAMASKVVVEPVVKVKAGIVKAAMKVFKKASRKFERAQEMLKYESILASMYNMSQISDYGRLKKYVYHFVLRFRYWHKPKKKIQWNIYSPTMYKVNMTILPKCSKRVLRWHLNIMRIEDQRRFFIEAQKKNRHRATIIQRRKRIVDAWQRKHMSRLKKKGFKQKAKEARHKMKHKKDIAQRKKDKMRAEGLEEAKANRPQVHGGFGFGRKLKKKHGVHGKKKKLVKGKDKKKRRLRGRRGHHNRNRRGQHNRHNRRGGRRRRMKMPWWHKPRPWERPGFKRFSKKGIPIQADRQEFNFRVKSMYNSEAAYIRSKRRHCDYRCRLKRLPNNIDYNNMCILPKKFARKKRLYFYGKFRKKPNGDWYPHHSSDRGFRKDMRRNNRRRSPFKKRRRRRLRGRKLKQTKAATETKKGFKVQKFKSPPERHLSLANSIKDVLKPISKSAYNLISKLYKKPLVEKHDRGEEYKEKQMKAQEDYLSPERKLNEKLTQLNSTQIVEKSDSVPEQPAVRSLKDGASQETLADLEQGATSDGVSSQENRKLFFKMPRLPRIGGLPKIRAPRLSNPFAKGGGASNFFNSLKPKKPKEDNMLKNPKDQFHVKEPNMKGKYKPGINSTRAKKAIPLLLKEKMMLTSVPKGFFYKKLKYPLAMMGSILPRDEVVTCRTFKRHLFKPFINVNKEKIRYCYRVYDSLKSFDTDNFRKGLVIMRQKLMDVIHLKRGFYCSICDFERQANFDHRNKLVIYSGDFCMDFLKEYRELINFQNVILVEYMDQMLQLVECYRGNGNFFDFPYRTMLEMHKRRIFFIQRCFAHRLAQKLHPEKRGKVENDSFEQEGFLKHCMFICKQFNFVKFSPFIDGDLRTLNIVLMRLFQYLREMQFSPYLPSPPYEFLIPKVFTATVDSQLEKSRGYKNSLDDFIRSQYNLGQTSGISKKAMTKDNKEEKLRKMVNRLQFDLFYKKRHFDEAIDSIGFFKRLRKRLYMEKMMSIHPPNYLPEQIKMAKRARKEKARQKMYKKRLGGMQGKVKNNTSKIIRREKAILRKVKYAFEDAARQHKKHLKKIKRMKKKGKQDMKRLKGGGRKLHIKDKLESMENSEDLTLMQTYKDLKNDGSYYGIDNQEAPRLNITGEDQIDTSKLAPSIPERRLSKKQKGKKGKKSKKKRRKRKKKSKKKVIILSSKVKQKDGSYKLGQFPHHVISWPKYRQKILSKKNKRVDRHPDLTRRQNGDFGYYPPDSEHIMHGIYQEKRKFYDLKKYSPMYFLHLRGLNPLFDAAHMKDKINPEAIMRAEYDLRHPERFNEGVLKQYFGIPNQTVNEFNFDIKDSHYVDLVRLKEMKGQRKPSKRSKKFKKRDPNKPLRRAKVNEQMMKRQNVYPRKHKNPDHFELGLHEFDPSTTADNDSQFMFYMFDHRSRYPIFRNT